MIKDISIRMAEQDFEKTQDLLFADLPRETATFLLAGARSTTDAHELLVRRVIEIPRSEYRLKESYHLDISPRAINGLMSLCEANDLGVILCHPLTDKRSV